MISKKTMVYTLALTMLSTAAGASDLTSKIETLTLDKIRTLMSNPEVIKSVNEQNERNKNISQSDIDKLDKQWRAETKKSGGELVDITLANPVTKHLKKMKSEGQGLFTEIIVMDNHGLNVGQSDMTSDYWQGDEAKWKQTFLVGPDAVHVSKVEFDESTQTYQAQISISISDQQTKAVIGAATFGINADAL